MRGPSSVTATVCSQCAARDPSAVVTVHSSSSTTVFAGSQGQHRFDRQHRSRRPAWGRGRASPRWAGTGPCASAGRCRGRRSPRRSRTCARSGPRPRACRSRWRAIRRSAGCRASSPRSRPPSTPWSPATAVRRRGSASPTPNVIAAVAVPAVEDRAAVDGHQVTGARVSAGRRDAVHDTVVDRGADGRRDSRGSRGTTGCRRRRGSPIRRSRRARASRPRGRRPRAPPAARRRPPRPAAAIASSSPALRCGDHLAITQPGPGRSSVTLPSACSARANTSSTRADGVDGLQVGRCSTPAAARSRRGTPSSGCG